MDSDKRHSGNGMEEEEVQMEEEMEDNPLRVQVDRRRAEEVVLHCCWTPDTAVISPLGKARSQNAKLTLLDSCAVTTVGCDVKACTR